MKKSEAVLSILIYTHNATAAVKLEDFSLNEIAIASGLLNRLQRLGMLPPEDEKDHMYGMYDLEHVRYAHKWSEETETNEITMVIGE